MSDCNAYLTSAGSAVIHSTRVIKKKWKLIIQFNLTKRNGVYQANISTKTNKNDLSAGVFRSRLEQENSHY